MSRDELATQIVILGLTGRDPKEQFTSTRHISRKDGRTSGHQPTGRAGRHSRSQVFCLAPEKNKSPDVVENIDFEIQRGQDSLSPLASVELTQQLRNDLSQRVRWSHPSPSGRSSTQLDTRIDHSYPQSRTGLRSTSMQLKKVCHEGSYGIKWPGDPRRRARGTGCERSAITAGISSRCSEE
ncbi:hypothetical protein Bbelb_447180 [Branchiostoma belcheri]|nr:hypothetical protein Bbelb_447180 [Branchiostoma belcheri]